MFVKHVLLSAAFAFFVSFPSSAMDLSVPTGEVVLTVKGKIGKTNQDQAAAFDVAMLKAIGEVTFDTSTPWTEGVQTFTGVPLGAFLKSIEAEAVTLSAVAVNDYSVQIPMSEALGEAAIIAYERNGEPMSIREKGPLWIVFPYDSALKWRTEEVYSYSIWQLISIDVKSD
jgi:hypothetical protein